MLLTKVSPLKKNTHMLPTIKPVKLIVVTSLLLNTQKLKIVKIKKKPYKNNQLPLPLMLADGHLTPVVSSPTVEPH